MNNMRVLLFSLVLLSVPAFGHCEDQSQRVVNTAEGQISDIDWAGSKMTVKWLSQDDNVFHETTISVPDDAVMRKNGDSIDFSELEISDDVTVKYYEDFYGNATLINLNVTNPD